MATIYDQLKQGDRKCPKCGSRRMDRHGCQDCDDPQARLAKMEAYHKQFWRDVRAGKVTLKRRAKAQKGGA